MKWAEMPIDVFLTPALDSPLDWTEEEIHATSKSWGCKHTSRDVQETKFLKKNEYISGSPSRFSSGDLPPRGTHLLLSPPPPHRPDPITSVAWDWVEVSTWRTHFLYPNQNHTSFSSVDCSEKWQLLGTGNGRRKTWFLQSQVSSFCVQTCFFQVRLTLA